MQLKSLVEEAKIIIGNSGRHSDEKKTQLVSLIREHVTKEYFTTRGGISQINSEELRMLQKYLNVAKKLEKTIFALQKSGVVMFK